MEVLPLTNDVSPSLLASLTRTSEIFRQMGFEKAVVEESKKLYDLSVRVIVPFPRHADILKPTFTPLRPESTQSLHYPAKNWQST